MRAPVYSTRFKKDYKLCQKRGFAMQKLLATMRAFESEMPLSSQYKEHPLQGNYSGCMECHIEPDWLLVYQIDDEIKEVYFIRTGRHSDIF
jgi:mRNA interferase YafQ